jgi:hypothetical protein
MAITQLEGIIFANQNMNVVASRQIDLQGRIDFQNLVAVASANSKTKEIEETNALQEGKQIDADREHNKEKSEEETGAKKEETKIKFESIEKKDDDLPTTHLLDIKA